MRSPVTGSVTSSGTFSPVPEVRFFGENEDKNGNGNAPQVGFIVGDVVIVLVASGYAVEAPPDVVEERVSCEGASGSRRGSIKVVGPAFVFGKNGE